MRYFFSRHLPPETRILLVESGSRRLIEGVVPTLRSIFGAEVEIDLVTCFPGSPEGFTGTIYRIHDFGGSTGRHVLFEELAKKDHTILGIICSAEPVMTKWKWWLAAKLPAKVFLLNENGDFFWWDRAHWRLILHFLLYRAGLVGSAAVPTLVRFLLFPATLAFLIVYAVCVHAQRRFRLLWHRA